MCYNVIALSSKSALHSKGSEDLVKQGFIPKSEFNSKKMNQDLILVLFLIMGWRIVYIEESDYLSLYLDNLKIKRESNDLLMPLSDIHTLIIDNYKSILSIPLINKCSEYNVNLIICNISHLPQAIMSPISGKNQAPIVFKNQLKWDENKKMIIHKNIVINKIINQAQVLIKNKKNQDVINKLLKFSNEVQNGDATNREGLSAKIYFRELFGKEFTRFADDTVNSALNYGYSIMRSQISKVLIAKGLNTSLGIFHRGSENEFNLSDDIIEVFRPIIDDYVYKNIIGKNFLEREDRLNLIKLTTNNFRYKNEKHTFLNAMSLYITMIIDYFNESEVDEFVAPKFNDYGI